MGCHFLLQESFSFTLSPILILCKIILKSDILPGLKNYSFSPEPKSLSYFMYLNLCPESWCILRLHLARSSDLYRRRQWQPTPVFLPGKSHRRRSLVGCSPWGSWGSHTTERLHFHFSLSCIGEGNGNPLQCSCLENPRDGGAWWAAVYGVAQSWTWLKWLSIA